MKKNHPDKPCETLKDLNEHHGGGISGNSHKNSAIDIAANKAMCKYLLKLGRFRDPS